MLFRYPAQMLDTMQSFRIKLRILVGCCDLPRRARPEHGDCVAAGIRDWLWERGSKPGRPFLASLGFVANNIPVTPAGLGVGEAALESLFRLAGLEGAMLAWRLLLVGLAPLGLWYFLQGRAAARVRADSSP